MSFPFGRQSPLAPAPKSIAAPVSKRRCVCFQKWRGCAMMPLTCPSHPLSFLHLHLHLHLRLRLRLRLRLHLSPPSCVALALVFRLPKRSQDPPIFCPCNRHPKLLPLAFSWKASATAPFKRSTRVRRKLLQLRCLAPALLWLRLLTMRRLAVL